MAIKKAAKRALPVTAVVGEANITILHEDAIRVDLMGECLPSATGLVSEGWGSATLTAAQAIEVSKKLAAAAVQTSPTKRKP